MQWRSLASQRLVNGQLLSLFHRGHVEQRSMSTRRCSKTLRRYRHSSNTLWVPCIWSHDQSVTWYPCAYCCWKSVCGMHTSKPMIQLNSPDLTHQTGCPTAVTPQLFCLCVVLSRLNSLRLYPCGYLHAYFFLVAEV